MYFADGVADATIVVSAEQRDVVRDYMERLVASMLADSGTDAGSYSSNLDRVPIGQLSTSLTCTYIFYESVCHTRYHQSVICFILCIVQNVRQTLDYSPCTIYR